MKNWKRNIFMAIFMTMATLSLGVIQPAQAAEHYVMDTAKHHAFITFKISHLGFSWMLGRFDNFSGDFTYDPQHPENNAARVTIDVTSIDTNHAKRDKHLRSGDFFDVEHFPTATFVSTGYEDKGNGKGMLKGTFTLRGISKNIRIDVHQVGTGKDPWGGYRRGFEGRTTLHLSDYNMKKAAMLGPVAENIELYLSFEGIRQQ